MDLSNLAPVAGVEEEKDTLGGMSFTVPSGADDYVVALAYFEKAKSGSLALHLHLKSDTALLRLPLYVTTGDAKGNLPYTENAKGEKKYMKGYNIANAITFCITGKNMNQLQTEDKVAKLYDFTAKKELDRVVPALTDLMGETITLGVIKCIDDKNVQDATGEWVASGQTKEVNEIDKVFRTSDKLTVAEIKAKATEEAFYTKWVETKTGTVWDRSEAKDGAVKDGAPAAANKPKSLFGDDVADTPAAE